MSATGGCGCEGPEHSTGRTLSQKGTDKASTHACSLLGGSGVGWFMESPHDFDAVHWDHEPVWVVPSVWCPAFRRPGPAKAGTPNRRFMERNCGLLLACIILTMWADRTRPRAESKCCGTAPDCRARTIRCSHEADGVYRNYPVRDRVWCRKAFCDGERPRRCAGRSHKPF